MYCSFSGGKDSTFALYYIVNKLKLKPLVVRFDHGFLRPNLEENVKRCQRKIGFDMLTFISNWKIAQKLMLRSFLDKGDFVGIVIQVYFLTPCGFQLKKISC